MIYITMWKIKKKKKTYLGLKTSHVSAAASTATAVAASTHWGGLELGMGDVKGGSLVVIVVAVGCYRSGGRLLFYYFAAC